MSGFGNNLFNTGGVPVGGLFATGNTYFVKPYSGSNTKNSGQSPRRAFKTLAYALSQATANNGDVVYLIAESNTAANTTDYQSVALDWNKDGVHLIGVNAGSAISQRSRIAAANTVGTIEDLFTVSATGCRIENIEVYHGPTVSTAAAPRAAVVSGSHNYIRNCQFSGIGEANGANSMDVAGARSLAVTGSENVFENCYLGLDTLIRTTATTEVEIVSGARNIFRKCMFSTYTSTTAFVPITVGAACDRFVLFDECTFYAAANVTSAAAPAGVFNALTMNGLVLLKNPYVVGCTKIAAADNAYIKVLGFLGLAVASGNLIGLAQTVDA